MSEDVADVGPADTDPGHGFKVVGEALIADVVVDPIPVTARTGVGWRVGRRRAQGRSLRMEGNKHGRENGEQAKCGFIHGDRPDRRLSATP